MNKKPLNLLVNTDLVDKAKKHGMNLSAFLNLNSKNIWIIIIEIEKLESISAGAGN